MNTLNRRAACRAWPLTKSNVIVKIIGGTQASPAPRYATALKNQ